MSDRINPPQSMADRLRAEEPLGAAAAKSAVDSVALMNRVVTEAGLTQAKLASLLGVTEARVSKILNGDGNVKIATLARVLCAAGYGLDVSSQSPTAR